MANKVEEEELGGRQLLEELVHLLLQRLLGAGAAALELLLITRTLTVLLLRMRGSTLVSLTAMARNLSLVAGAEQPSSTQ